MIFLVDKETQIKVLLYGDPLRFACETLGVNNMLHHNYSEVFTVSKEEVFAYTESHGILQSASSNQYSLAEGFHYFKEEGKWYTFLGRGILFTMKRFLQMMSLVESILFTLCYN